MATPLPSDDALQWMLDTDPALRWQVERDLLDEPADVWQATRARVATEGMGAELLSHQDADGQWAGGAYFPADFDWGGEVDACINGFTLANGAWLGGAQSGADVDGIATWFAEHSMAEGGFNCEWVEGSTRASFHSTLNSLKGILDWEERTGDTRLRPLRHAAEEYLLRRRMLYRESTGELVAPWATHFAYPFRHVYSALNALDYLRRASLLEGTPPDERASDAIGVLREAQQPDGLRFPGTWLQERCHPGRVWFELDVPVGEPSPWLTFLSLRVLRWWEARG
jgi:hypothetical protein